MPEAVLNGARIHYQVQGDGFPLVLTHGLGSDHTMWFSQAPVFKDRYKVVTWDVRGHGRSEVTANGYSIGQFVEDLHALLGHLGIRRAHIGGLSMGGWISYSFALAHPEATASLVLSNSGGIKAGMLDKQLDDGRKLFLISARVAEVHGRSLMVDNTIALMFSPDFIRGNPEIIEMTRQRILADSGLGYARTVRGILIDYWDEPAAKVMNALARIDKPSLVIGGDLDLLTPWPTQEALARAIPGARFELIRGSGHVAPIEKPEFWNRLVLEFLESVHV